MRRLIVCLGACALWGAANGAFAQDPFQAMEISIEQAEPRPADLPPLPIPADDPWPPVEPAPVQEMLPTGPVPTRIHRASEIDDAAHDLLYEREVRRAQQRTARLEAYRSRGLSPLRPSALRSARCVGDVVLWQYPAGVPAHPAGLRVR